MTHKDCVKFNQWIKKHAIAVPLVGTREFNVLCKSMARKSTYDLHSIRRLLSYASDRQHTVGHVKISRRAIRQYGMIKPLSTSNGAKSANLLPKVAHDYGIYKV